MAEVLAQMTFISNCTYIHIFSPLANGFMLYILGNKIKIHVLFSGLNIVGADPTVIPSVSVNFISLYFFITIFFL